MSSAESNSVPGMIMYLQYLVGDLVGVEVSIKSKLPTEAMKFHGTTWQLYFASCYKKNSDVRNHIFFFCQTLSCAVWK